MPTQNPHTKDPSRVLRGQIGAAVQQSRNDPREYTQAARAGFLRKFEREVDPDGTLSAEERQRRAEAARRAHMLRLAYASAKARRRRARRGGGGGDA